MSCSFESGVLEQGDIYNIQGRGGGLRSKTAVSNVIVVCEEIKRGSCFKIFN